MEQRGGWKGLTIGVASVLFEAYGISFEDRKKTEGSYIAFHPNGQIIRKPKVTETVSTVISDWFTFKK